MWIKEVLLALRQLTYVKVISILILWQDSKLPVHLTDSVDWSRTDKQWKFGFVCVQKVHKK